METWDELRDGRELLRDDDLLVLDKPAGWSVMGERHDTDVVRLARDAGETLWPAHRIDKVTSGLVLFARRLEAHGDLTRQFADRTVAKTYLAVATGTGLPERGTIELPAVGRSQEPRAHRGAARGDHPRRRRLDGPRRRRPARRPLPVDDGLRAPVGRRRADPARGHADDGAPPPDPRAPRLDRPRARRRPAVREGPADPHRPARLAPGLHRPGRHAPRARGVPGEDFRELAPAYDFS